MADELNSAGSPEEIFGREVKAKRDGLGWSMTDLSGKLAAAGLTNFYPTTIGRMERGERPVRLSEAVVIAGILGLRLDALLQQGPTTYSDGYRDGLNAARSALDSIRVPRG